MTLKKLFIAVLLFSTYLTSTSGYSQNIKSLNNDSTRVEESGLDVKLFRTINNYRPGFLETIIPITDKSVLPAAIVVPLGLGGISRLNKNYYDENTAILMILSEITSAGITSGLKYIVRRERPYAELRNVYVRKDNSPTDRYSFPSGHTSMVFSMATTLTLRYPDKPAVIAGSYLYAALIGYGRIFLGVHYPSDVLGGMIIGSGSTAIVYSLRKEIIEFKNDIFNEKGRPDSNSEMSAGAILGIAVGTDLINTFTERMFGNKVNVYSNGNTINAVIHF